MAEPAGTSAARAATRDDEWADLIETYQDLLGSIWLYIRWFHVTRQLTTEQKELFADAVDAHSRRLNAADPDLKVGPAHRWWRDAADA